MPQPWEIDWSKQQSTAGPVLGPPPSPKDQAAEGRAQNAEQRAQEDQQFQREKFALDKQKFDIEKKNATEGERKAGAFLLRALGSNESYEAIDTDPKTPGIQGIGPYSAPGQSVQDNFPNLKNVLPAWLGGNDPNRQVANSNQDEFIAASLRQDSGAAIPEQELERQRRIYFPMPGDGPEAIEAKRQARLRAIEGLRQSAGRLEPSTEERFQRMYGGTPPVIDAPQAPGPTGGGTGGGTPGGDNPFTGLPAKSEGGPSDPIGEDPRFEGKRYNESGQEDPSGDFNAYGQYRDFRASQSSPDGALQGSVTSFDGQPQESIDNWTNWTDSRGRTRGPDGSILGGWQGPGQGGSYKNALQQELQRQGKNDPNSAENYTMRGAQGASFSLLDELTGAMSAAKGAAQGQDPVLSYQLTRDLERSRQRQNVEGQGWTGTGLEIGGSLLTGGLLGRVNSARTATATGAKGGALYGFGSGEGFSDSTSRAGVGAAGGAALGGGLNKFGEKVISPGVNALAQSRVGQAVKNAFTRSEGAADETVNALNPAELVAAGKANNTRVLTSDALPPTTAVGKTARIIGENIPFFGTGGVRAAQQAERTAAVSRFAKEFEAQEGSIDAVTKNLIKTRGKQIETFTKAKNEVIESVPGKVQATNTLTALDNKIAELTARDTATSRELADVLKGMRGEFKGKTLPQLEAMRTDELSAAFKSEGMAKIRDLGEKTMRSLYGPLKEDMGAFIKANGRPSDFNKWSSANKKLSGMMGDLKSSKFKSTLNNAETTPEDAAKLLFSKTPSDVQRLVKELSPVGQAKARSAVVEKALEQSMDDATGAVIPDKFLTAINALKPSTGPLFKGADGERLDGLVKLLAGTRRAASSNAEIPTGLQGTRLSIAGVGVTNPQIGIPAGILARAYESAPVRNLLIKLSRTKAGSPAEEATRNRLLELITRMSTQRVPEAANDTIGRALSQSPGRAAAQDETN